MERLASAFEGSVGEIIQHVSSAATKMEIFGQFTDGNCGKDSRIVLCRGVCRRCRVLRM